MDAGHGLSDVSIEIGHVPRALQAEWETLPRATLQTPEERGSARRGDVSGAASWTYAELESEHVLAVGRCLRENGARLRARPLDEILEAISDVADEWAASGPERERVVEALAAATRRTPRLLADSLDSLLATWTRDALRERVRIALGDPRAIDGFVPGPSGRKRRAVAPRLVWHRLAGNTPWAGLESLVCALLARAPSLARVSRREPIACRLFADALARRDPEAGDAIAIAYWEHDRRDLDRAAASCADVVTAFGDEHALAPLLEEVRSAVARGELRLVLHGPKASVAVCAASARRDELAAAEAARRLAIDFTLENQEGCLSPQVAYIEEDPPTASGGAGSRPAVSIEAFAERVAAAMEERERVWPRGAADAGSAAAVQQERGALALRGARLWQPPDSTAWTVVLDEAGSPEPTPLGRFVWLRRVARLSEVPAYLEPLRGRLGTVGIAAPDPVPEKLAGELADLGVTRICPLGEMQRPPLEWNHDGQGDLASLVTWAELEPGRAGPSSEEGRNG